MHGISSVWIFSDAGERNLTELGKQLEAEVDRLQLQGVGRFELEKVNDSDDIAAVLLKCPPKELTNLVAIVDLKAEKACWPPNQESIASLGGIWRLQLLFPEVYWIVLVGESSESEAVEKRGLPREFTQEIDNLTSAFQQSHVAHRDNPREVCNLLGIHAAGFRTLFDPSGVRRMLTGSPREFWGLAIEDEWSFCLLNAYFMYRRGGAVSLAFSANEFVRQLDWFAVRGGTRVAMEDLELNFADKSVDTLRDAVIAPARINGKQEPWGSLVVRRGDRWGLRSFDTRVILTGVADIVEIENECRKADQTNVRVCSKPYAGLCDPSVLGGGLRSAAAQWLAPRAEDSRQERSHSPAGASQEVAAQILARVREGNDEDLDFEVTLVRAVMAKTADQLLKGRPLHLAAEAAHQIHVLEVCVELSWVGLVATIPTSVLRIRYRELKEHMGAVAEASMPSGAKSRTAGTRPPTHLMLHACSEIRRLFDSRNRRLEEEFFLVKYREWMRRNWQQGRQIVFITSSQMGKIVGKGFRLARWLLGWVGLGYLNFVMRGWWALAISSAVWIVAFAVYFSSLVARAGGVDSVGSLQYSILDWMLHSAAVFSSFLDKLDGGFGVADFFARACPTVLAERVDLARKFWAAMVAESYLGLAHLGALVTILVERFSRR